MSLTAGRENGRRRPRGYAPWRPQAKTRALLADVAEVLDRYYEHLPLTIRQVFYALVGAGKIDKTENAYERLCEHLNRARRAELIPFAVIRDDGVTVMRSVFYADPEDFQEDTARRIRAYRRDRQHGQDVFVELWAEAAGMVPQLASVADEFSVPVYSAGGFASLSVTHLIAERALERMVPTVLLHVGDFDPSGESIFAAMAGDAAEFVEADRSVKILSIEAVRVALTAEQVAAHDLPTTPAKATDSRAKAWSGGTCQLEALPPDRLAAVVRHAIEACLDENLIADQVDAEKLDRAELLGLPSGEGA